MLFLSKLFLFRSYVFISSFFFSFFSIFTYTFTHSFSCVRRIVSHILNYTIAFFWKGNRAHASLLCYRGIFFHGYTHCFQQRVCNSAFGSLLNLRCNRSTAFLFVCHLICFYMVIICLMFLFSAHSHSHLVFYRLIFLYQLLL